MYSLVPHPNAVSGWASGKLAVGANPRTKAESNLGYEGKCTDFITRNGASDHLSWASRMPAQLGWLARPYDLVWHRCFVAHTQGGNIPIFQVWQDIFAFGVGKSGETLAQSDSVRICLYLSLYCNFWICNINADSECILLMQASTNGCCHVDNCTQLRRHLQPRCTCKYAASSHDRVAHQARNNLNKYNHETNLKCLPRFTTFMWRYASCLEPRPNLFGCGVSRKVT
jgi:hypothetical protein